jgi:Uma2 family endonuclease
MGMPRQATRWTADMVRALPDDGNRYEEADGGLLVTPAPVELHQRAVAVLLIELGIYARACGGCEGASLPCRHRAGSARNATGRADRTTNRRRFQRVGVPEYVHEERL